MNMDMRWYGSFSGSVIAITMRNSAQRAFEENHFSPFSTHSSPSSTASVRKTLGSDPPWGSVIEKQEKILPSRSGWRYFSLCAGVP
jgi:hypothetical protein